MISNGIIEAVQPNIEFTISTDLVEVHNLYGATVVPGYVDGHVHITGGGGEMGANSRVPECYISELVSAGITTVIGLLGTDCISRSLENLLVKVRSLEEDGISAYMLTGSYRIPAPTLTGSIMSDMVLIDKVIGSKVASSDHRSPAASTEELARHFSETRVGGLIGGKAGISVVHMGRGRAGLRPLLDATEQSDCNLNQILPTHMGRCGPLFVEGLHYISLGGNIDLTADAPEVAAVSGGAARLVTQALEAGADISHIYYI